VTRGCDASYTSYSALLACLTISSWNDHQLFRDSCSLAKPVIHMTGDLLLASEASQPIHLYAAFSLLYVTGTAPTTMFHVILNLRENFSL
jgi:hypothetical protein